MCSSRVFPRIILYPSLCLLFLNLTWLLDAWKFRSFFYLFAYCSCCRSTDCPFVFQVVIPSEAATSSSDIKVDWVFAFTEKNKEEIETVRRMEAERRAALEAEVRP